MFNNSDEVFNKHLTVYGNYPAQNPGDKHILFLAEKFMPAGFLAEENKNILWFAKAVIDASKPIEQPLITG